MELDLAIGEKDGDTVLTGATQDFMKNGFFDLVKNSFQQAESTAVEYFFLNVIQQLDIEWM